MMATTHALLGVVLVLPLVWVAPDLAPVAAVGAFCGGLFPDLDVLYEHRKTLHYPVYYWAVALPALLVALLVARPVTVAAAAFCCSAAVHSVTDAFGGGLGVRPWESDDERGVYLAHQRRWVRPRRWVRYDGAPEDLVFAVTLAVPALLAYPEPVRALVVLGVVASGAYTVFRKRIPDVVPERFL